MNYVQDAIRTESPVWTSPNPRYLHAAMGLVTESIELLTFNNQDNFVEELGDILWYCAIICDETGIEFNVTNKGLDPTVDSIERLITLAGDTMDAMKRGCFYGKPMDEGRIVRNVREIICHVENLAAEVGADLEEVQQKNIAKLRKRFPDKFTIDSVHNRNTAEEMKVFRG